MMINEQPLLALAVDNFGIVIVDIISNKVVDMLRFELLISELKSDFSIYNIISLGKNRMRVFIENRGYISMQWQKISKIGEKGHIFVGLNLIFYSLFENQITPNIINYSARGYAEVIYHKHDEMSHYHAIVQVFMDYNHNNSKMFREFALGTVNK